jgi:uncharacterized membrane protein
MLLFLIKLLSQYVGLTNGTEFLYLVKNTLYFMVFVCVLQCFVHKPEKEMAKERNSHINKQMHSFTVRRQFFVVSKLSVLLFPHLLGLYERSIDVRQVCSNIITRLPS